MSEELKPCPFCGGKAETKCFYPIGNHYPLNEEDVRCPVVYVGCTKCGIDIAYTPTQWNNRPADDEPETNILLERQAKRIKELENAIQIHCKKCWAIFRGSDPAQCRTCSLYRYKQTDPPMVWEP